LVAVEVRRCGGALLLPLWVVVFVVRRLQATLLLLLLILLDSPSSWRCRLALC
jgi:hypothetical protein